MSIEFEEDIDLLTADELRKMTADPEVLYKAQLKSSIQSLMSTIVKMNNQFGKTVYSTSFMVENVDRLVPDIKTTFGNIGYSVNSKEVEDKAGNKQVHLTIDWSE